MVLQKTKEKPEEEGGLRARARQRGACIGDGFRGPVSGGAMRVFLVDVVRDLKRGDLVSGFCAS